MNNTVSKNEIEVLERIFMLKMSINLLKQGRGPFHREAIRILYKKIEKLKKSASAS